MATFDVLIKEINSVSDHDNADRLSVLKIEGYLCIHAKNEDGTHAFKAGDRVAYIPEFATVPDWVLQRIGLWNEDENKGMLHGAKGNIVRAKKLRGVFSQGLIYPVVKDKLETPDGKHDVQLEQDVSELLGIKKWEEPIPKKMSGDHCHLNEKFIMCYDFENYQKHPGIFSEGDDVRILEKGHGTFITIGYNPSLSKKELINGNLYSSSKGINAKCLVFKDKPAPDNEEEIKNKIAFYETNKWIKLIPFIRNHFAGKAKKMRRLVYCNEQNVYQNFLRRMVNTGFAEWIEQKRVELNADSIHLFGEVMGKGIQDLSYGFDEPAMRIFDVAVNKNFLPDDELVAFLESNNTASKEYTQMMPVLYRGPFSVETATKLRDGKTTFGGGHIREGIVVTSRTEESHVRYGRKVAKFVSPAYLTRKNGSEHQ